MEPAGATLVRTAALMYRKSALERSVSIPCGSEPPILRTASELKIEPSLVEVGRCELGPEVG